MERGLLRIVRIHAQEQSELIDGNEEKLLGPCPSVQWLEVWWDRVVDILFPPGVKGVHERSNWMPDRQPSIFPAPKEGILYAPHARR